MRFALLGTHPDGLEMACALVGTGRHELLAYSGRSIPAATLACWGPKAEAVGDLEEVLANPAVDAVIVAGTLANRPAQLRRSLQSDRHVLCVHPPDRTPDAAYEAAMIQADTGRVLFPLLPYALHPAVERLAGFARSPGATRLLEVEYHAAGEFLLEPDENQVKWCLPGWDVLRAVGGEIVEVSALTAREAVELGQPLVLSGVFERGGLFHVSFVANARRRQSRATAIGERDRIELLFPVGRHGPAFLTRLDERGELVEEHFPAWDPWPALVDAFEVATGDRPESGPANAETRVTAGTQYSVSSSRLATARSFVRPSWQDVICALELDDAARRAVAKRRSSVLEYPEATEETGFKGTMTLVGCGLFWLVLLLLILSAWKPWLGWFIVPVLVIFLALQALRWVVRRRPDDG
jgi:predicted dehydrogenase